MMAGGVVVEYWLIAVYSVCLLSETRPVQHKKDFKKLQLCYYRIDRRRRRARVRAITLQVLTCSRGRFA